MTRNGRLLALTSLLALALAVVLASRATAAAGLVLSSLVIVDALLFLLAQRAAARAGLTRRIGAGREHGVVFCGTPADVTVRILNPTRYHVALAVEDLAPEHGSVEGSSRHEGTIPPGGGATIAYRVSSDCLANLRFSGLALAVLSPGGFFRSERFVPLPGTVRVVPDIFGKHRVGSWRKGSNVLLRHGRHLQRRAGMGAELLSLRPYREGDPLKAIAWRASARRGELLIKEFESEVPVRARIVFQPGARLLSDGSGRAAAMATMLARLARLLAEHRDLVELIVLGPQRIARTGLGLTRRHLGAILTALGDAIATPPAVPGPLAARELARTVATAFHLEPGLRRAADALLALRFRIGIARNDVRSAQLVAALFLSARFNLGVGGTALLDRYPHILGFFARRFAADHGIIFRPPADHAAAWSLAEGPRQARMLERTLDRLQKRAGDEELHIVVADLATLPEAALRSLAQRCKRGRAYGHRFVVFWPADGGAPSSAPLGEALARAAGDAEGFRRQLRALGIPSGPLRSGDSFRDVIAQVNLLRRKTEVRTW